MGRNVLRSIVLILGWSLAGCVSTPSPAVPPLSSQDVAQFVAEQQARRQGLDRWRAEGVIAITSSRWNGRHRVVLFGEGSERARMTLFGPFQQVVG